ncbi:MFS transporter [Thermocrispum municipale]|uniref:MFS transporter n=1 Tax=Thermocrispum municipale TaxID=37926 RepID=UPI000410C580|nr:MFS transporter [Thermocrispum municipale]
MASTPQAQIGYRALPREVWVLVSANVLIAAGFGLVAPAIPVFAKSFDVGISAASLVVSAFAGARLLFAPATGPLITKLGERKVYMTGLIIVAVSTGAAGFAQTYTQLVVFRGLGGIGSTMFTVSAVALLIHLTPPPLRGRASGLFGAGFLTGNVIGPLGGSGLMVISLRAPFLIYAALLLVASFLVWLLLRNSTLIGRVDADTAPGVTLGQALRNHAYRASLLANFAFGWFVFGVRVALLPLFIVQQLHESESLSGIAFGVYAAVNVVALLPVGRLADRIGRKPLILVGLVITSGGVVWLGLSGSVVEMLLASAVAGIGTGALTPPNQAAVADVVGAKGRGGPVLAAFQMAADVGAIVGPYVAGLIAEGSSFALAFGVTGALTLLAAAVWLPAPETLPRTPDEPHHPTPEQACELDAREAR